MKHKELVPYAHVANVNRSVEFYLPSGEFSVHDPDGYAVMIAQHE